MALHFPFSIGKRTWLAGVTCALVLGFAPGAGATTLTFDLSVLFGTGTSPEGTPPWLTATFDDSFGGPNTVRLTLSASGLVDAEAVSPWYFNFNPALDPTQITFTPINITASTPVIATGVNAFMADGDGNFDIRFTFPPPPGSNAARFTSGETVIYDLTYISPIDVSDFDFFSVGGPPNGGSFLSAAHVLRIGPSNSDSGWIGAVPEPATAALFGLGLLGLAAVGRRR